MALTFVKRSTLPASVKGKMGSNSITITRNGQMIISSLATKALNGSKNVVMAFEAGKVYLFKHDAKVVAKVAENDRINLNTSKKGGTTSFAASAILRDTNTFGAHIYDFKTSGNQSFPVTVDEKNGCLVFDLPSGSLAPKPVTHRVKKAKVVATVANPGETAGTSVAEEELVLEPA